MVFPLTDELIHMRSTAKDSKSVPFPVYYPLLILITFWPVLAYMHRSKIAARGIELNYLREFASYYHADILPLLLYACLIAFFKRLRPFSILLLSPLYYLLVFDWFSWHTQGNAFFFSDIYRAIQLIIFYPEFIHQLSTVFKLKAAILLSFPIILGLIIMFSQLPVRLLANKKLTERTVTLLVITCIGATPFLINVHYLTYNSIIFFSKEQYRSHKLETLAVAPEKMRNHFGLQTQDVSPPRTAEPSLKNFNVILYVMETIPQPLYPSMQQLIEETNSDWLKQNAIVFENHHSTHPESDRSNYSVITGKYPPMWKTRAWKSDMNYGDSLPNVLRSSGYTTYLLVTAPLAFNNDFDMYKNIGFEQMADIPAVKDLLTKTDNGYRMDRDGLYPADETLIEKATSTIQAHITNSKSPFLIYIAPQSSHAPFHCPPTAIEGGACDNDQEKINANATWQFNLLAKFINDIGESGITNNTILVVTGDHGIRSKQETALFTDANKLQESTFRVPLLMAAPNLRDIFFHTSEPSSHIDVTPTLLHILGIDASNYDFHGVDLATTRDRTIYFSGEGYLPANGFLRSGIYFMENRSNGARYASKTFNFDRNKRLAMSLEEQDHVSEELLSFEVFLNQIYSSKPNYQTDIR